MNAILVECHDCGLRLKLAPLEPHHVARCPRCAALLRSHTAQDSVLALAIAGLVLVLVANFMPFMSFSLVGREQNANLASGAIALYRDGYWPLTVLILLMTVAMPAMKLSAIIYVLSHLRRRRPPPRIIPVLRWLDELHPWAMVEVYMLGIFVAYVRMSAQPGATVTLGVAVYALAALMLVMAAMDAVIDYDDLWEEIERKGVVSPPPPRPQAELVRCHVCGIMSADDAAHARCYRCGATLHRRRPNSIARCWALVATAAILYIPANAYPILSLVSFGKAETHTILSGVEELFANHDYPLAALVFFASIFVPGLKILGLSTLLVRTQRGWGGHLVGWTRIYRFIDAVGRWSMIDIFMMSILVALVHLGTIASIIPGKAAVAFAAVVVMTMFAAMMFDPRLMWDRAGQNR